MSPTRPARPCGRHRQVQRNRAGANHQTHRRGLSIVLPAGGRSMTEVRPEAAPDPLLRQMRELERGMTIRTAELERENRRLRRIWMGTLVSVALLLGLATALVLVAARHGLPGTVADVIEARQFMLRDKNGTIRGSWTAADDGSMRLQLQAPGTKAGLSLSVLAGGASGITVRDSAGRSRAVLGLLPDQTVSMLFADENGTRTV